MQEINVRLRTRYFHTSTEMQAMPKKESSGSAAHVQEPRPRRSYTRDGLGRRRKNMKKELKELKVGIFLQSSIEQNPQWHPW